MTSSVELLKKVNQYYSDKIKKYGATPAGVDWNSKESQYLRFIQLGKVISVEKFSLLDFGCGYGAFLDYLTKGNDKGFHYTGYDISDEMLDKAKETFKSHVGKPIFTNKIPKNKFDFVIASGIFNVKPEHTNNEDWYKYILEHINIFAKLSNRGFAFNVLTSYSDEEFKKDYLYYANPMEIFHYIKQNISRNVAVLHDYNLYEFTIIVREIA